MICRGEKRNQVGNKNRALWKTGNRETPALQFGGVTTKINPAADMERSFLWNKRKLDFEEPVEWLAKLPKNQGGLMQALKNRDEGVMSLLLIPSTTTGK